MPNRRQFVTALLLLGFSILFGCSASASGPATTAPRPLHVLTYNIHHGQGTDGKLDLDRIARIIRDSRADLVALQEVDVNTKRVPHDTPAVLAKLTGLPHTAYAKAIDYQGGAYGQAILSRYPLVAQDIRRLPNTPGRELRIALAVTVRPDSNRPPLRFVSTHLDHQLDAERAAQAKDLLAWLDTPGAPPTILAGDFNATPESGTMAIFFERFTDTAGGGVGPTIPADRPRTRIDYFLASKGQKWGVGRSQVLDEPVASDHRPVLVELTPP